MYKYIKKYLQKTDLAFDADARYDFGFGGWVGLQAQRLYKPLTYERKIEQRCPIAITTNNMRSVSDVLTSKVPNNHSLVFGADFMFDFIVAWNDKKIMSVTLNPYRG